MLNVKYTVINYQGYKTYNVIVEVSTPFSRIENLAP